MNWNRPFSSLSLFYISCQFDKMTLHIVIVHREKEKRRNEREWENNSYSQQAMTIMHTFAFSLSLSCVCSILESCVCVTLWIAYTFHKCVWFQSILKFLFPILDRWELFNVLIIVPVNHHLVTRKIKIAFFFSIIVTTILH
jgi:hypothetical protein